MVTARGLHMCVHIMNKNTDKPTGNEAAHFGQGPARCVSWLVVVFCYILCVILYILNILCYYMFILYNIIYIYIIYPAFSCDL